MDFGRICSSIGIRGSIGICTSIGSGLGLGVGLALCFLLAPVAPARALGVETGVELPEHSKSPGAAIYRERCASCHDQGIERAPVRLLLGYLRPELIVESLTTGVMSTQGAELSAQERKLVAEYLSGRELADRAEAPPLALCAGERAAFDFGEPPPFSGWGLDPANTHAVSTEVAGIDRASAGKLKLKWAFGVPDSIRMRSQPALAGGAIFFGTHASAVYALDRETGCARWKFAAQSEVRTGIIVSPWRAGDSEAKPLVYFGDVAGNAYAVSAISGELVWKVDADSHPAAVLTGAPALHGDTLYVPVSSLEEASAATPSYACCTFRGSILALDAATGAERWRTYLVGEPTQRKAREGASDVIGPSGVAVWSSPAIDVKRGQLYVATGDNYSVPATELSDAIVALDLATGAINWHYQALAGDAWNVSCITQDRTNCPEDEGPDYDFGAGPVLAGNGAGRELVLAGQKSGIAYGIDPDTGDLIWQTRLGRGGAAGGVQFGIAASSGRLFVPISDLFEIPSEFPARPGLHALDLASGEPLWSSLAPDVCGERPLCQRSFAGAVTVTPELVLAGSDDGHVRIWDAADGKVLWDEPTAREFETVNGVSARGGAIAGGVAPIAYRGQLIVASGYGFGAKLPGNVLLVYEVD